MAQHGENPRGETAMSTLDKQTCKFLSRVADNLPHLDKTTMQEWIENPIALQEFLKGLTIAPGSYHSKSIASSRIVKVDRTKPPRLKIQKSTPAKPGLSRSGPSQYDLATLPSVAPSPQEKKMTGYTVVADLEERGIFERCLSLQDASAIVEKDPELFRMIFGDSVLYFWKSVLFTQEGRKCVPVLVSEEIQGKVTTVFHLYPLDAVVNIDRDPVYLYP